MMCSHDVNVMLFVRGQVAVLPTRTAPYGLAESNEAESKQRKVEAGICVVAIVQYLGIVNDPIGTEQTLSTVLPNFGIKRAARPAA